MLIGLMLLVFDVDKVIGPWDAGQSRLKELLGSEDSDQDEADGGGHRESYT